jgi:hypothetical protein
MTPLRGNMVRLNSRREGFALAGAVLAMLVVGAIVTGGFYAANQHSQVARSGYLGDLAQYIAETGLEATVGRTSARTMDGYALNSVNTVYSNVPVSYGGTVVGTYTATITRTTSSLFIVRATGTVSVGGANSGATRTVASIIRIRMVDFDNNTAMQVYGDLNVGGTAEVSGSDTYLSQWTDDGCTTSSSSAVTAQPGASITTSGSGDIEGSVTRQNMTSANFTVFGDMTWDEVKAMATKVYVHNTVLSQIQESCTPSGCASTSTCNTASTSNWGNPTSTTSPCRNYFPIIYAQGNLSISANGSGQGILLVEGELRITSQFDFYGPVVVKGTMDVGAGGATITGSVFAFGGGTIGADNNIAGSTVVHYSSCSISRAIYGATGLSRGVAVKNRSFLDLTNVQNSY